MEAPKIVRKDVPIPIIVEGYNEEERADRSSSSATPLLEQTFCSPRFSLPCFNHCRAVRSTPSSSSSFWERIGSSHYDNRWWAPGLRVIKKIREWSELIAGPKWKTFIRRIRRKGCRNPGAAAGSSVGGGGGGGGGKLNYDLVNYSLNFDECHGNFDDEDEFRRLRSFSVAYGRGGGGGGGVATEGGGGRKGKDGAGLSAA
ncbi:hypothetical protein MLD38_012553 [Melastoma candidum]|uniref:Uncharacterized protein n=1 Tax=Melastoma candidum TaxID=119954 RepID=A0ACB9R7S0_9MYRT|nr:hypothetical protein MLD38_012553 [Melastoma candidum]